MPKVALYNTDGAQVGEIELNDSIFGVEVNKSAMHNMVVNHLANLRQGTQSTKTRAEVRGGGAKPWKQKGTGRARQGSIRSPQWKGGGVALGPKPRDYRFSVNKKVRQLAMKSALTTKVLDNDIMVLDKLEMPQIKTKEFVKILNNLNVTGKVLIVTNEKNENVVRSANNLRGVTTAIATALSVYDILNHDKFIIEQDAVRRIEEVYAV